MNRFANYVTSTAFNLSLSKNMIERLAAYRYPKYKDRVIHNHGNGIAAIGALQRRGLVSHISDGQKFIMTQEGSLVLDLCELAELLEESMMNDEAA